MAQFNAININNLNRNSVAGWDLAKLQNFKTYFSEKIAKDIADLSQKTANLKQFRDRFLWIGGGIILVELLATVILKNAALAGLLIFSFILGLVFYYLLISKPETKLNKEFKSRIIPQVFNYLVPGGDYYNKVDSKDHLNYRSVKDIFNEQIGNPDLTVTMEDMFVGKTGGIPFSFCELNIVKTVTKFVAVNNSEGKPENKETKEKIIVFNGLYVKSKFLDTGYKGFTYLVDKEHIHNNTYDLLQKLELIKLESPEFNKFFNVYSNDQIEARMALQTNLMYELTELRKTMPGGVSLLITPEDVEMFVSSNSNLFELNLGKDLLNVDTYLDVLVPLSKCIELIETVNTNKQISIN